MIEIWRNVVGYEGLYQVSNWGRVKSLERYNSRGLKRKERIMKPQRDRGGYLIVTLYKDDNPKHWKVHRLVGMAFADLVDWAEKAKGKPFEELDINHKKEKTNNHVENLEWCDRKYNNNYGDHNENVSKALTNGKLSKTVYQFTLSGEFVREWLSLAEVHRQTGWSSGNISACCRGEQKTAYGSLWSYDKDFLLFKSDNSNLTSLPSC